MIKKYMTFAFVFLFIGLVSATPTITINSPEAKTYNANQFTIDVSADESISSWWYSFDRGQNNITLSPPETLNLTGEGIFELTVWGQNAVGENGSSSVLFSNGITHPSEVTPNTNSMTDSALTRTIGALAKFFNSIF